MKLKQNDTAVTEIIATTLLLGMTVSIFSIVCMVVLSYPISSAPPSVNLVAMIDEDWLFIEHRGGESLPLDTTVTFIIEEKSTTITVKDYSFSSVDAKLNGQWDVGECFIYHDSELKDNIVDVIVTDQQTNSVVMSSIIEVR
jgi:hypothetical protein